MTAIQQRLKTYRNEIKGAAILWVVFFHAQLGLGGIWYDIQKIGYGGVDMFFFLSGFGLYHSLSRGTKGYFKRRALRILPAYLPFCLVWLAVMIPLSGMGLGQAVRTAAGNLFMLGYFFDTPLMINWYISALAASLLVAPVLFLLLQEGKGYWPRIALILTASFALGLLFVGDGRYMAVSRLPVFVLGMVFARPYDVNAKARPIVVLMTAGALVVLCVLLYCFQYRPDTLLRYAMYWHPFVLIAPALCCGLGWLFSKWPPRMLAPLRALGSASFEIFLFNVWAELLGKRYGLGTGPTAWMVLSAASLLLGLLYHQITASKKFCGFFEKKG